MSHHKDAVSQTSSTSEDQKAWVPRATRLRVDAPIAYRCGTEDRWAAGSTVDISRTGLLFQLTDAPVPEVGDLQIVIFLSRAGSQTSFPPYRIPDLYCGGRITRIAHDVDGKAAVAMCIDFESADTPPERFWDTRIRD